MDLYQVLESVKKWAQDIGDFQVKAQTSSFRTETKSSDVDIVTEIDKQSEAMLIERIQGAFPDHDILGEESGLHGSNSPWRWVLDPIDGTVNYAHGLDVFSISIALQYKEKTVLGVVYLPAQKKMFWAIKGAGAFENSKKLQVSSCQNLKQALLATGFPYDQDVHPINNIDYFSHLSPKAQGVRRFGTAAYDLCLIAAGKFDVYWEVSLRLWDIAAGTLIVEEAQGTILYFRQDREYSVIAGNSGIVDLVHKEIQFVDSQRKNI